MIMALAITRTDLSAADLRAAACRTDDSDQARRLLALALVMEGSTRTDAARSAGMDRQTLRDWVARYNAEGVEGLRDRERPGRPALLAPELEEELRQLIEAGPDLERDGVVEYRVRHIRGLALRHFGVDYSRSGMQGRLHCMKLSYLKPRPILPKADPAAQEAFKKTSPG